MYITALKQPGFLFNLKFSLKYIAHLHCAYAAGVNMVSLTHTKMVRDAERDTKCLVGGVVVRLVHGAWALIRTMTVSCSCQSDFFKLMIE